MKLLTPKEIKQEKRKEMAKDLVLAQKVQEVATKKRKELNSIKSNFISQKEAQELEFHTFSDEINQKKSELTNEVNLLEERKKEALKPIDALKEEVQSAKTLLDEEKQKFEDEKEQYEIKNTQLEAKEKSLKKREATVTASEEHIGEQRMEITTDQEELDKRKHEFGIKQEDHSTQVLENKKTLSEKAERLIQERGALEREKMALQSRQTENDEERRQLLDQRQTLEREIERRKKK